MNKSITLLLGAGLALMAGGVSAACLPSPVDGTPRITSPFGPRIAPTPQASSFHKGIDISTNHRVGPVYAVMDGTIFAKPMTNAGHGAVLKGANGYQVVYFDLDGRGFPFPMGRSIPVRAGQRIGMSANPSENSTGYHLHFETWPGGGWGGGAKKPVDPVSQLCAADGSTTNPNGGDAGAGGGIGGGDVPPAPPLDSYAAFSVDDVIRAEAERRVVGADWAQSMGIIGGTGLLREIANIYAFRTWLRYYEDQMWTHIETLLATRAAMRIEKLNAARLEAARQAAAQAAN